jgi:signal transduction histidine kinase
VVFVIVYSVVYITAYRHLDDQIRSEKEEVFSDIHWKGDSLLPDLMSEKLEAEHRQAEVSPTFLQLVDAKHRLVFKSANLQNDHLLFADSLIVPVFFNIEFNGKLIRQGQFPIFNDSGHLIGQLDIGLPQVESMLILSNLQLTMCIVFPLMLLVFYLATSWAASRGIAPVHQLIKTTGKIGDKNINIRIPLPSHKDEIHQLTSTINDLLGRIEVSLNREKQITADISHELRTPVTGIRGTLEVLIRKTREPAQYEEKIRSVIGEVDSLNRIIDQMLQLSRLDAGNMTFTKSAVGLSKLIHGIKDRWKRRLDEQNILLEVEIAPEVTVLADKGYLEIMLENLISNAVKYGSSGERVICCWNTIENSLSVSDNGQGIPADQVPYIFNRFYRTDASRSSQVQGTGLGLSIVKTLADLQEIRINVTSNPGAGTTFTLHFSS